MKCIIKECFFAGTVCFSFIFFQMKQLICLINPDNYKCVQVIDLRKTKYNPTKTNGILKICPMLIGKLFSNTSWFAFKNSIRNRTEKTSVRNNPNKNPCFNRTPLLL